MPDWLRTVDWALLRAQKQWLLAQPESAEAQGLVGLLDAIHVS
jgi:hypothetical protein